eukprot:Blabericola_migrator_1__2742@NODE_1782_length_3799_cov_120_045820_g1148_i0_p2_GENE_NODE_1782_length_3799_cov_120_045820_g1148_i0NODE_1782_length_3799_cov_120_045820_g1148_i0_p2_ORF_typecomplete_len494_score85_66Hexokinase_1/PF00349_21/2e47Hexokinase_2/PF03727_16/3_1e45_NODE_1782_length_3799_cov_120_045820_g1148_i0711552
MTDNRFSFQNKAAESVEERCKRYIGYFNWDSNELKALRDEFNADCRQALRHHKNNHTEDPATLPFLDTCVERPATGREKGTFYAIDFGGTNLRIVRVILDGEGGYHCDSQARNLREMELGPQYPKGLLDPKATATMLFDTLAKFTKDFMTKNGDLEKAGENLYPVGFTFSFPLKQTSLASGWCPTWTKGFETGMETDDRVDGGPDVCQLLQAAFERNACPAFVAAVLNDTTGTLLTTAYTTNSDAKMPACSIGFIVGTGMNACYYDRSAKEFGYQGLLINTELGNFRRGLKRNIIDLQVDLADVKPNSMPLEKMCAGLCIPEMCRRAILRVFAWTAPPLAWCRQSLSTGACMAAAYDRSANLERVKELCHVQLEWNVEDMKRLTMVRDLCYAVLKRSANLLAVCIAALAKQTGKLQYAAGGVTVGIDGSVYTKNPEYREDVDKTLKDILGPSIASLIKIKISSDGSGLGAAILAAVGSEYVQPPAVSRSRSFF